MRIFKWESEVKNCGVFLAMIKRYERRKKAELCHTQGVTERKMGTDVLSTDGDFTILAKAKDRQKVTDRKYSLYNLNSKMIGGRRDKLR